MPKYKILVAIVGTNFSYAQGDEIDIIPNGEADIWLRHGIAEEIGKSPIHTAAAKMENVETTSKKRK